MIGCPEEKHRVSENTETHRGYFARRVRRGRPLAGPAEVTRDRECKRVPFVVSLAFAISRDLLPRAARPCGPVPGGYPSRLHLQRPFRVVRVFRGLHSYVSVRLCDLCASVLLFRLGALHV
jgi:hypothetical protein